MKLLMHKGLKSRAFIECLILGIPFSCWVLCFWNFFNGRLHLEQDAVSYADHICWYVANLSKGVFPLWDPTWFSGAPNDFFLRRIGDVNPLLFFLVILKWCGVPSMSGYLVFLGVYYFLAAWALYLIACSFFKDRFYAFILYILFLFSSWGSELFYNYIIIIFVPIVWFFYFLLSFARDARKVYFLGLCLCLGVIVTTYIPFFFLTIFLIFIGCFSLFYFRELLDFLKCAQGFLSRNKIFTCACVVVLLMACIPALLFYKESKAGEFVLPGRHLGATTSSMVGVGLENVASGDLVSHGFFDRIFDDHAHIDMGDIYIPYVFFILLAVTVCARVDKFVFFALLNILILFLITITSAGNLHHFLYAHIPYFKFIRNIYYFFWLAILPMALFLAVKVFQSLLEGIHHSSRKMSWFVFVMMVHGVLALFLSTREGVLWGAWVAWGMSAVYFGIYFLFQIRSLREAVFSRFINTSHERWVYGAGFLLLFLAVVIQSVQVYQCMDNKLFQGYRENLHYAKMREGVRVARPVKGDLYYASYWFGVVYDNIDAEILDRYLKHLFVFYDNVVPVSETPSFFKTWERILSRNTNVAFVARLESQASDWQQSATSAISADRDPQASGLIRVLKTDANTWHLRISLPKRRFLVINDSYNSDWHAFIDGHPVGILRANVAFKGLWISAGTSDIVLRFSKPLRYVFHEVLIAVFAGLFLYMLVLLRRSNV